MESLSKHVKMENAGRKQFSSCCRAKLNLYTYSGSYIFFVLVSDYKLKLDPPSDLELKIENGQMILRWSRNTYAKNFVKGMSLIFNLYSDVLERKSHVNLFLIDSINMTSVNA